MTLFFFVIKSDQAGIRTQDPILKRDVLYRLSYLVVLFSKCKGSPFFITGKSFQIILILILHKSLLVRKIIFIYFYTFTNNYRKTCFFRKYSLLLQNESYRFSYEIRNKIKRRHWRIII